VISAVERFKHVISKDATVVVILPDRGERYLDTIYSDTWVKEHFGDVSHLWETTRAAA
jgi:cysteine synthase A